MVSGRISIIQESATLKISQKVKELMNKGYDVIPLNIGQPDFDTPEIIKEGAITALKEGKTKYVSPQGIPELREKISEYYAQKYGVDVSPNNIIIAPTKYLIYASLLVIGDLGSTVLIPDPGWVSYKWQAYLAGLKTEYYTYDEESNPRIEIIEDFAHKSAGIIINSPSNPLGTLIDVSYLEDIYEISEKHDMTIISDEIYEGIVFDGKHTSLIELDPKLEHTIVISGFSKLFAMTGWRLGWAVASHETIKALTKIMQHTITCATSFAQYGAIYAFTDEAFEENRKMVEEYRKRRDIVVEEVKKLGWDIIIPRATFYAFPKYDSNKPSEQIVNELLEKAYVALTPGSSFGPSGEGKVRISYAISEERLREAFKRIREVWDDLR